MTTTTDPMEKFTAMNWGKANVSSVFWVIVPSMDLARRTPTVPIHQPSCLLLNLPPSSLMMAVILTIHLVRNGFWVSALYTTIAMKKHPAQRMARQRLPMMTARRKVLLRGEHQLSLSQLRSLPQSL